MHDQADHIGPTLLAYDEALRKLGVVYELIVVANACSDGSADICRATGVQQLRVIEEDQGGWGRAVKRGLAEASGNVLCYTNSARTSAGTLVLMLAYSLAYPEVVIKANRRLRESFVRRLGSLVYNVECRILFELAVWDVNGTPKIFPRHFDRLSGLTRDDDLIDIEFLSICKQSDYPIIEVPILETRRRGGVSTTNYRSAVAMYWGAYRMSRALDVTG